MNWIIRIIKSLEDQAVLIDGVTATVKHEIKNQESGFYGALLAPLEELEELKEDIRMNIFSSTLSFKQ